MFTVTKDNYLTRLAMSGILVWISNLYRTLESGNHEKKFKAVNGRKVRSRPGVHETGSYKDSIRSYQEPREVPLAEKA